MLKVKAVTDLKKTSNNVARLSPPEMLSLALLEGYN